MFGLSSLAFYTFRVILLIVNVVLGYITVTYYINGHRTFCL